VRTDNEVNSEQMECELPKYFASSANYHPIALINEAIVNRILQLFEENAQLKSELLASKDEHTKSLTTIGELCCENDQLKKQVVTLEETNEKHSSCINQLKEEISRQQQEMNNIRFNMQQQLLDNNNKQNDLNNMEKQLLKKEEKLKETQEIHVKAEEELIRKQLELDNRIKEVEQEEKELDDKKQTLNTREAQLNEGQLIRRVEHVGKVDELNNCINAYPTKQKEYNAMIIALIQALSIYNK
jgi:chromosome segregation ATPase